MDIVLVGLPGSGKTAVGRAVAAASGARFVDLDAEVEASAGVTVAAIFEREGEPAFRRRERQAIEALGPPDPSPEVRRVIAVGGGAVADPRSRWRLYRGRASVWLDAPIEQLAARVGRKPGARPLLAGADIAATLERLRRERLPAYAAASVRVEARGSIPAIAAAVAAAVQTSAAESRSACALLRQETTVGRFILGVGVAAAAVDQELRDAGARRAVLVSEPGAWEAAGVAVAGALETGGWATERLLLPTGEAAKRLDVIGDAAEQLAAMGLERDEPIVAIGGGALTDAAGFLASTYARGVPWLAVPTTLVGQVDAALGGKTGLDLAAGKNLLGAFHPPVAVVADVAVLAGLPERERRAALAEATKVAVLGEPRLLDILEADGPAIAAGTGESLESGALAEVVEWAARFKLAVVERDPLERGERICLNLGHTLGHAIEAATGFGPLRHGEAVAYGLRAAMRLGVARGTASEARAARVGALLDRLALGVDPLPCPVDDVLAHLGRDKKRQAGTIRWVLPTEDAWTVDASVPASLVASVAADVLAGRVAAVPS